MTETEVKEKLETIQNLALVWQYVFAQSNVPENVAKAKVSLLETIIELTNDVIEFCVETPS